MNGTGYVRLRSARMAKRVVPHRRPADGHWTLEQLRRAYVAEILRATGGDLSAAAGVLGVDASTLAGERIRADRPE